MKTLFFLIAFGCIAVVGAVEPGCNNCGCCVNKVCNSWGKCTEGCKDGIWGDRCFNACPEICVACERNREVRSTGPDPPCTKCTDGKHPGPNRDCSGVCPQTCVKCSSYTVCSECKSGYFNDGSVTNCSLTCPLNCECSNGDCVRCKAGYHDVNDYCHGVCPDGCISCSSADQCNECESGKYGVTCQNDCSNGCSGGTCNKDSGNCVCKTGFSGMKCDQCAADKYGTNCENDCSVGCSSGTCNSNDGICTCRQYFDGDKCDQCVAGMYGIDCDKSCSNGCYQNVCNKDGTCSCKTYFSGDYCNQCVDGRYGTYCNNLCSNGCTGNVCNQNDGTCQCKTYFTGASCNQCVAGRFGTDCLSSCSVGCVDNLCSKHNGACTCQSYFTGTSCNQCVAGRYGTNCEHECSSGCSGGTCNRDYGTCYCKTGFDSAKCDRCVFGRYGTNCDHACSVGCSGGTCIRTDGSCTCKEGFEGTKCDQCETGKYGSNCEHNCSVGCSSTTCTRDTGACSCKADFTGTTCSKCVDGKYGASCHLGCSVGCVGGTCIKDDGTCSCKTNFDGGKCDACDAGKYGTYCDQDCSFGCSGGTCTKENGACSCKEEFSGTFCKDCAIGRYGNTCGEQCSVGCSGGLCDQQNGSCDCKQEFTGDMCNECVIGKYGNYCDQNCSNTCNNSICDRSNGHCEECVSDKFTGDHCEACQVGLFGNFCNATCPVNCENNICTKDNGDCLSCKPNFIGLKCDVCIDDRFGEDCSIECLSNNCEGGCDRNSGQCMQCPSGFFGPLCKNQCSAGCRNDSCDFLTGDCSCKGGFSGDKCCVQSNHCSTCVNSTECKSCEEDYYGTNCTLPCPGQCNGGCDKVSGTCVNCPLGMFGDLCNITCSETCMNITDDGIICDREDGNCSHGCLDGFHGSHCTYRCTRTCARRQCHQASGFCALGCSEGYNGQMCEQVIEDEGSVVLIAAGVSAAVVVIVAVVVVLFVLRHRRLKGNETHEAKSPVFGSVTTETHFGTVTPPEGDSNGKQVIPFYGNAPESKLSINKLYQKITSELGECKAEFKRLKQGMQQPHADAKRHENQSKNRYRGLYPYDHSRVRIQSIPDFFINASYINGYQKDNAYIASLGPTKETTKDFETFWVMLWHHQSDIIVMLTNLQEPSGMKCHQYWPIVEADLTFGDLMIVGNSEEEHAEYTERIFTVTKGSQNRTVRQLHYTAWPDKSIPESITSLVEFHQRVVQLQQMSAGPIIVHCSAGIGRTGTYITLDRLTQEGRNEGAVNVFECVHGMREQRVNMVQTCDQYIYLYKTVVHSLMFDSEAISTDEFPSVVTSLNESSLQQQIRKLRQTFDVDNTEEQNAREVNAKHTSANRDGADIPGDYRRPRLYLDRKFSDSDYINAIFVDSFQRRNQFLVAQTPLPETLSDFVTLLYQENCECIVSMEDMMSNSSTIGTYLPPVNQDLDIGNFKITSSKCQTSQQYQVRKLTLTKIGQTNAAKEMYHFQYTKWNKKHNVPEDPGDFIQFMKEVEKYDSDSKTDVRPILVHCLTGAVKSGLFTVVWNLLEKMEAENQVSVLNTVRQVRLRRKKVIQNMEQLRFCYQCVNQYLNMFSTYSNFAVEPTPHRR